MGTLIHRIEYLAEGRQVAEAIWTGPLEGIVGIAQNAMAKKGATSARFVVEATGEEVWSGSAHIEARALRAPAGT